MLFGEELAERRAERVARLNLGEVPDVGCSTYRAFGNESAISRIAAGGTTTSCSPAITSAGAVILLASRRRSSPSSISAYITQTESQFIGAAHLVELLRASRWMCGSFSLPSSGRQHLS
jgi:hypothetical protein